MILNEILNKGISEYKKTNYKEAERIFRNCVKLYPDQKLIYTYLIPCLINENKLDDALSYSKKLYNLDNRSDIYRHYSF